MKPPTGACAAATALLLAQSAIFGPPAAATSPSGATATAPASGAGAGLAPAPAEGRGWPQPGPLGPRPTDWVGGVAYPEPNPYLAFVPRPDSVDWRYWERYAAQQGARRAAERPAGDRAKPLLHEEQEPATVLGSNDRPANAEPIRQFGTGAADNNAALILGRLAKERVSAERIRPSREDDGAIPLARRTGIPGNRMGVRTTGMAGDGPHGSAGSGHGDFDYYRVRVPAGRQIVAQASATRRSDLEPIVAIWGKSGGLRDFSFPRGNQARVAYPVPHPGTYYVMVVGCCTYPRDRFKSGSGTGAESEGRYRFQTTVTRVDQDFYSVHLRAGDVLGGTVRGEGRELNVYGPNNVRVFGSGFDATFIYPEESPLPGGGRAVVDHVAATTGRYTVEVTGGVGDYRADLEVYRPGLERDPAGTRQTLFLDFDGARVNTNIWGGPGVRELSPLSAFLGRWGLPRRKLDALADSIVANVRENIRRDLSRRGNNERFGVRILNSRDHADPWSQPNVSRVIVGGTIREAGIPTIGVAQSIDPGNYAHEESAVVLLDLLSGPDRLPYSLNHYLTKKSDKIAFIGRGIANIVAHEAGHFLGNWHVDQFDARPNLMDQGGNFKAMFGPGPDGVGGTADDKDTDFGRNRLNPFEPFRGVEDTLNRTAFGLTVG